MRSKKFQKNFRLLITGLILLVLIFAGCSMPGTNTDSDTDSNKDSNMQSNPVQTNEDNLMTTLASGSVTVTKVACGENYTMVLLSNGDLYATGHNMYGQLGTGDTIDRSYYVKVKSYIKDIACGRNHTLVLRTSGSVYVTGNNEHGQLGLGHTNDVLSFTKVTSSVSAIAAGGYHSMILKGSNLYAAGNNAQGQLGLSNNNNRSTFTKVTSVGDVKTMACGFSHTIALKNTGTLYATGYNGHGELGLGNTNNRNYFDKVYSVNGVSAISCGDYHSMALKGSTLYATGYNSQGQLGLGDTNNRDNFTQVTSVTYVKNIACGNYHTLVLKTSGSIYATGYNANGQLGIGDTMNQSAFTKVDINRGSSAIAAGYFHSMAVYNGGIYGAGAGSCIGAGSSGNKVYFTEVTFGNNYRPKWDPNYWSAEVVRFNNNCYNYACNKRTDTKAQPGIAGGGIIIIPGSIESWIEAAVADGLEYAGKSTNPPVPPEGKSLVFLIVDKGIGHHWVRQDEDNTWSHKDGTGLPSQVDYYGNKITNPMFMKHDPNMQYPLELIVGWFFVDSHYLSGQGRENIR